MTFDVTFEEQNKTIDGVFGDKVVVLPNGGGGSKEEWITIADTALTEDVASLEFTTDINGNPFECKRIIFQCVISKGLGNADAAWKLFVYSTDTETRGNAYITKNCYGCMLDSDVIPSIKCVRHRGGGYSAGDMGSWQEVLKHGFYITANFTRYGVYAQNYNFPANARIRVWGLKA